MLGHMKYAAALKGMAQAGSIGHDNVKEAEAGLDKSLKVAVASSPAW